MQFDLWFTLFVCVVGLLAAAGVTFLLVGYIDTIPASIAHGWGWAALVIGVPVLGPIWFCRQHWADCAKTGKQLMAGAVMLLLSIGLLYYGAGPFFAKRAMQNVDPASLSRGGKAATPSPVPVPPPAAPR